MIAARLPNAADLALLTGFQGVPAEFRGFLALVLLRRVADRLSANLEVLGRIAGADTDLSQCRSPEPLPGLLEPGPQHEGGAP